MIAFLLLFVTLGRLYRDMFKQPETRALMMMALARAGRSAWCFTRTWNTGAW